MLIRRNDSPERHQRGQSRLNSSVNDAMHADTYPAILRSGVFPPELRCSVSDSEPGPVVLVGVSYIGLSDWTAESKHKLASLHCSKPLGAVVIVYAAYRRRIDSTGINVRHPFYGTPLLVGCDSWRPMCLALYSSPHGSATMGKTKLQLVGNSRGQPDRRAFPRILHWNEKLTLVGLG